jgi:hypothetical protein
MAHLGQTRVVPSFPPRCCLLPPWAGAMPPPRAMPCSRACRLAAVCAQVDMTWSGHVHVYERTCPVLYKTCLGYDANGVARAPVHMDIGNGGCARACMRMLAPACARPGELAVEQGEPRRNNLTSAHPCSVVNMLRAGGAVRSPFAHGQRQQPDVHSPIAG